MSAEDTADAVDQLTDRRPGTRRPLLGAAVGTFIEFYDFAVYALTVPIVAASFFPPGDAAVALISAFAVYGVAFIVRPLGGVVFGAIGDRFGRRRVLMLVLTLIGVATALIGVLPTYEQVGLLAPLLLVALRVAQGLSAGGEVTSATSFALEHAPGHRRSTWITTVVAMSAVSSIVGLIVVLGLGAALPEAAFAAWGWRIPFLLALPLSLVGLYIRLRTDESPAFERAQRRKALSATPVREALARNGRAVFAAFALAAMSALAFYYLVGYFPTYLQVNAGLSRSDALLSNGVALVGFTACLIVAGSIGDRVGRLPMIRIGACLLVVTSPPAFLLAGSGSVAAAVAGQLLLALALCVFGGGSYAALLEVFPTRTRLSGAALGYNAGYALFGGTAPLLGSVLVTWTGSQYAPGYYLATVALLVLLCTFRLPETKETDIHA
ncbi:MFS transporter [Pseudonocardia zijingensis]|jgi:MHS family proline/betaine transporter-like MFS transporter|uniref:MFS transporter n=1 Tax=Pseudonocardia zijingensis TaxID=153376 RepID=A0ABP4BCP6_9PSEU